MRRPLFLFAAGLVALTACAGKSGAGRIVGSPPGTLCAAIRSQVPGPSATQLSVTAMDTKFDTKCLTAVADAPFTIRFDNEDSNTHNLDIRNGGASLFAGDIVIGPKVVTYYVGALPAGTYTFRCDVHPSQMNGVFIVSG